MKIKHYFTCLVLFLSTSVNSSPTDRVIELSSIDDLIILFEQLNYTQESWLKGNREVPRITFDAVSEFSTSGGREWLGYFKVYF